MLTFCLIVLIVYLTPTLLLLALCVYLRTIAKADIDITLKNTFSWSFAWPWWVIIGLIEDFKRRRENDSN
jgi:hypothetical protein